MFGKKKSVAGLDIGSSSVKMVELEGKLNNLSLVSLGFENLPADTIIDGQIMELNVVSDVIQSVCANHQVNATNVVTGVSGHSVILKNIVLPAMTHEELEESIDWHAEEHIPYDLADVSLDYQVTAETPPLQTDTSEVRADVGVVELENLPVPMGRNYQQIYRTLPGFSPPVNSHSIPSNPARSLEFNVNGTSDNQNNTRVDGVSTYNVFLAHVVSYIPTLESIQEVNVVTGTFDAEQGFAGGAAITLQTKSGTNQIHGSVFEYNSNNHLKAWQTLHGRTMEALSAFANGLRGYEVLQRLSDVPPRQMNKCSGEIALPDLVACFWCKDGVDTFPDYASAFRQADKENALDLPASFFLLVQEYEY